MNNSFSSWLRRAISSGAGASDSLSSSQKGQGAQRISELQLDSLEPRVLFSAAPVEPVPDSSAGEAAETPAESGGGDGQGETQDASAPLTQESLQEVADAAADRWRASGITAEQEVALDALTYSVGSLANPILGTHGDGAIVIDDDGAGRGWFVDTTADSDEEFSADGQALPGSAAEGRMDLLTILIHEQGHALGLADVEFGSGDVMADFLQSGTRVLPGSEQSAGAIPGTIETVETAGATIVVDSGGGGDHTTITAAVAAANSGDIIMVNNGTYNENVNLSSFTGDLTIQATNALGASWNDGGQAASSSGNSANIRISGFDLGNTEFTDVSGVITLDGNRIDRLDDFSNVGVSVQVSGGTQMGIHILDNDFDAVSFGEGIIVDTKMSSSSGFADVVIDGNTFTGITEGIFIGPRSQLDLTAGEINARIVDNVFSGRTSSGTEISIFGGSNVSNNLVVSALIDNNRSNTGGAPSGTGDGIKIDIDGANTTFNAIVTNNNFNYHDDGIYIDADSTTDGGTFNAIFSGNTLSSIEAEGIHLRPFSQPGGPRATWNFTLTGNTLTNINSDLSTGHAGIEIEVDNTSNDDYTFNLDLSGNNVSMAAGSPSSSYVVDANSTSGATVFIERDIASNNTGSVTIDDPGGIVTMPSANAVADSAEPRTVSGFVFHDSNGDGDQTGEAGVGGVAVTLVGTSAAGGAVSMTTFTDKDGNYAFPAVLPPNGSGYTLTVGTTTDLGSYTVQDAIADNIDSDVDQTTGQFTINYTGLGAAIDVDAGLVSSTPAPPATVDLSIADDTIGEEAGAAATTGTVTRNSDTTNALTVTLLSDDTTEATVIGSVTIPAGQTSATFDIDAVDDAIVDGTQTVTITASAAGHTGGSDTVDVTDNDLPSLTVSILDASISESDGAAATSGTVSRNTDTTNALTVNLLSDDTTEATVIGSVTIPAGQTSATFDIDAVDDAIVDGTQTVTITASAAAHTDGSDTVEVTDNDIASVTGWTQLGDDIDGEATSDESGFSVSFNANGDRVAIGARENDGNGNRSGHVRIYEWNGSAWTQLGNDIDGEATFDLSGHSVSFNAAGDRVAIGAIFNDGNGNNSGHVRIYEWNGSAWTQLGDDIDGEAADDESGGSVSFNAAGDRVVIGAIRNDGNGSTSGHVRIYEWNGSAWTQLGDDIDGEARDDFSGGSVSVNATGDRVAIGATANDGNGSASGHVRIYEWNGTAWTQLGDDIDGEAAFDVSGRSVSFNATGDRVAIGARENAGNGTNSGHVRIFEWDGTAWTQLGDDIDGEAAFDGSGNSVSFNATGDRVAIGATGNDGNGNSSGHVRIYEWNGTAWTQLSGDIDGEAAGDQSGRSVSFNATGDRVAIGATANSGNGNFSGHVRIFELSGATPAVPEIYVEHDATDVEISDGDTTPSDVANEGTDFGQVDTASGTEERTFLIRNDGTAVLTLTGAPALTTGNHFSISALSGGDLTLDPGETRTFTVTFDPTADGVHTDTLTILSDDADESTYDFLITGEGVTAPAPAENSATVSGGTLTVNSDGNKDTINISSDGTNLRISTPDDSIVGLAGTNTAANGDVEVPIAGLNSIVLNTGDGDDVINIDDLTGFAGELDIDGGDGQDAITFKADVTLDAGNGASFAAEEVDFVNASLTTQGTGSIAVDAAGATGSNSVGVDLAASSLRANGTGSVTLSGQGGDSGSNNQGIQLTGGSSISTANGDINITGTGGSGASSANQGVMVHGSSSLSAGGDGTLSISGTGGNGSSFNDGVYLVSGSSASVENGDMIITGIGGDGSGPSNRGIQLAGTSLSSTGSGEIILSGTGSGSGASNTGLLLKNSLINATGNGGISLQGTGSANGTSQNQGIALTGGTLATASGNIDIDGTGYGSTTYNQGVVIQGATTLAAAATGSVSIDGTGGNGTNYNDGVLLTTNSHVSSANGSISVGGTGRGSLSYNRGIQINGLSSIRSSGAGNVTLLGNGSSSATSVSNSGVFSSGGILSTNLGDLTITGNGGTGSNYNSGVRLNGGTYESALGDLNLQGSANAATSGVFNYGVWILNAALSGGASASITGTGGGGSALNHGTYLQGISGSLAPADVSGSVTDGNATSKETFGNFFP